MKIEDYRKLKENFIKDGFETLKRAGLNKKKIYNLAKDKKAIQRWRYDLKFERIFLGIACEFFLKALYIKNDFLIFKVREPIKIQEFENSWNPDRTIDFHNLIESLDLVYNYPNIKEMKKYLHILKMWRNGEIHNYSSSIRVDGSEEQGVILSLKKLIFLAK